MGLFDIVSGLSSFATLHTWIIDQSSKVSDKVNMRRLDKIDLEIKSEIEKCFHTEYEINKIDEFIAGHSLEFKSYGISALFTKEEKESVINKFLMENRGLNEENTINIFNQYFYMLQEYLNKNLSFETKFLKKVIDDQGKHIVSTISKLMVNMEDKNMFKNSEFSKRIIGICTSINTLLLNSKLKITLLKKPFAADYLIADNLDDVFLKLTNFFRNFSAEEMNEKSGIESKEPLESLFKLVIIISPDLSIELNQYYERTVKQTLNCVNGYSEKTKEFYIALGSLGLAYDNSDEKIYETVMNNLYFLFVKIYEILNEYSKEKDYLPFENSTIDDMYKHIYFRIKWYFDNDSKEMLKKIYERQEIIDTKLADELNVDISFLRRTLHSATKEFLSYKYLNNNSTIIYIDKTYRKVIEKYYYELFEDTNYED
ncbi:hypothetical protein [Cytobacillus praedii]|uniref:hypothetical protein n=1 Tax=Cytobacillus praedii TaxID=1742358 RepID=UPI002E231A2E|nr:hypothetical protein [Cytobacillus praedii]